MSKFVFLHLRLFLPDQPTSLSVQTQAATVNWSRPRPPGLPRRASYLKKDNLNHECHGHGFPSRHGPGLHPPGPLALEAWPRLQPEARFQFTPFYFKTLVYGTSPHPPIPFSTRNGAKQACHPARARLPERMCVQCWEVRNGTATRSAKGCKGSLQLRICARPCRQRDHGA